MQGHPRFKLTIRVYVTITYTSQLFIVLYFYHVSFRDIPDCFNLSTRLSRLQWLCEQSCILLTLDTYARETREKTAAWQFMIIYALWLY